MHFNGVLNSCCARRELGVWIARAAVWRTPICRSLCEDVENSFWQLHGEVLKKLWGNLCQGGALTPIRSIRPFDAETSQSDPYAAELRFQHRTRYGFGIACNHLHAASTFNSHSYASLQVARNTIRPALPMILPGKCLLKSALHDASP